MKIAAVILLGATIASSAMGCGSSTPATKTVSAIDLKNDPCADRLHEISGLLLQYYALYRKLPATLEDLRSLETGSSRLVMSCPVSGKPYIYSARALSVTPTATVRIVVYDATPVHDGMRLAISVVEPSGAGSLSTSVVAVPDSAIPRNPLEADGKK